MGHEFSQSVAIFSTKLYGITPYWSGTKETLLNSITKEWKIKFTDFFYVALNVCGTRTLLVNKHNNFKNIYHAV